jgi:hypothetical protein
MEVNQTRSFAEVAASLVAELRFDAAGELAVHTGQMESVAENVMEHMGLVAAARRRRMIPEAVVLRMVVLVELPAASQAPARICSALAQMRVEHYKVKDHELLVAA